MMTIRWMAGRLLTVNSLSVTAVWLVLLLIVGCGRSSDSASEPLFEQRVTDDYCAVLTRTDVSAAANVPETQLSQRTVSGCLYSWENGTVWLASVRVHDTIDGAQREFARFTVDARENDPEAQRQAYTDGLERTAGSGEPTGGQAQAGSETAEFTPGGTIIHRLLEDVGNEARLSNDGSARFRYGNVTVWFTGKTGDRDWIDPEVASELGRRIVRNLDSL